MSAPLAGAFSSEGRSYSYTPSDPVCVVETEEV
jgi:hypothetical protein